MRIKFNNTWVQEVNHLSIVIGISANGVISATLSTDMYDNEYDYFGELDVSDCASTSEAEEKAAAIIDEVFTTGVWDISTEEKCNKYGVTIW